MTRQNQANRKKGKSRREREPVIPIRKHSPPPRRRTSGKRILQVMGVLLIGSALGTIYSSPWMHVRNITISGLSRLTPDEAARVQTLAVIPLRTHILNAPARDLAAILRRLPFVANSDVRRKLPGTLEIDVVPRQPAAILECRGSRWELDSRGIVIRQARPDVKLPVIAVDSAIDPQPGQAPEEETVPLLIAGLKKLVSSSCTRVRKIDIDQNHDICLNMDDGVLIRLGQTDDLETKLALIAHIYQETPKIGQEVESMDLRSPDAPACTPRVVGKQSRRKKVSLPSNPHPGDTSTTG